MQEIDPVVVEYMKYCWQFESNDLSTADIIKAWCDSIQDYREIVFKCQILKFGEVNTITKTVDSKDLEPKYLESIGFYHEVAYMHVFDFIHEELKKRGAAQIKYEEMYGLPYDRQYDNTYHSWIQWYWSTRHDNT